MQMPQVTTNSPLIRSLLPQLQSSLEEFPAVGLIGPRQVGKTSLARLLAKNWGGKAVMLDLERPSDLAKLTEPELFLEPLAQSLVILDEIQLRPALFPVLRALIDSDRRPGRFLILGSAAPELMRQSAQSLAGRIEFLEMQPFTLAEVRGTASDGAAADDAETRAYQRLWLRGGFPNSFLASSDAASVRWREAFVRSYLERDIPQLGIRVPAATLRRFWQMLAHHHGQLWNASSIASAMGLSAPTVSHYLDILESTFMVRVLQPFHANLGKRLVKSPKVYIRDSGVLHHLLNLPRYADVLGHPVVGASWEGFVLEQLLAQAPRGTRPMFYRTASGNEVDVLLELPGGALRAVEIKHSVSPTVGKGFYETLSALGLNEGFVVAPVAQGYPLSAQTRVLALEEIGAIWK